MGLRVMVVLVVFCASLSHLFAQGFGSIQGTVVDTSGAVVVGASIVATQTNTGQQATVPTNDSGRFTFPQLAPTQYTLRVTSSGFVTYTQKGITLQADQSLMLNVVLKVGSSGDVVTVTADATQVNTTDGALSQVVNSAQVEELPLNGRNAAQLTTLVAGAVAGPNDGADQGVTKTFPVVASTSINGSRVFETSYMLDGGNNVDEYTNVNGPFPFPDALQEFSVQTSNYNAEYGQNAGGVVNIVIKTGQAKYHGVLFEYLRNGVFNAASPFGYVQSSQTTPPVKTVDPLKRNQFGGTISGPLGIPRLGKVPSTFFMFGYQKSLWRNQTPSNAFVPTDAERTGDFSALLTVNANNPIGATESVKNPSTGTKYKNNIVPTSAFDPAAVALLQDLPHATGNGQTYYRVPLKENFDEYVTRVDHSFSDKDQMFVHFFSDAFLYGGYLDPRNLLTYTDGSNIVYRSSLISETHVFTPHLLNNIIVNYMQELAQRHAPDNAPDLADYGVKIWQPDLKAIERLKVKGYFSLGANPYAQFQRNSYNLSDDVHWVRGNHNFAFGGRIELSKIDNGGPYQEPGLFTFNKRAGDGAASFLLGSVTTFVQGAGTYSALRNKFSGFYAQDSWKLTRRLSLSYGLRYEPYLPWTEAGKRTEVFDPAAYAAHRTSSIYVNAPAGLLFPGDQGVEPQGYRPLFSNFEPRLGFALDVFGDGKTSLRGGGGVFYDSRTQGTYSSNAAQVTPFGVSVQYTNPVGPFSNPYQGITNPFPTPTNLATNGVFPLPVQVFTYNANGYLPPPVTYQWNLGMEQQITNNLMSRIAYVGSRSTHLTTFLEENPGQANTSGTDGARLYPNFSTITNTNNGANATYHSLQVTMQQRLSHGLTYSFNYTWAKSLDDVPYDPGDLLSYVYPIYYPNFRSLDQGRSDFDRRHVFSASYVWKLPKLNSQAAVLRALVNGWETTGIVQVQSGDALTIISTADTSDTAIGQDRAQFNGTKAYGGGSCTSSSGPCRNFLNVSAFSSPAYGSFGNMGKGALTGPGYVNWDSGLYRVFPIYAQTVLQFRAEYFNVLNKTNLADPVNDVAASGFGNIISNGGYTPRIAQLSLKLRF
ncbi:TonB-dependent receptor [Granulicella pectinivorans]|uniref:TonB-dependent receptor n=1 Tax=Granulicella pectinivorans TaxID=474950 RepID=UPI001587C213|nr:carboxypeptidase-like regulatory domain-containing protein [Granulicella pectinivorans]